jgi:hypothetical protein
MIPLSAGDSRQNRPFILHPAAGTVHAIVSHRTGRVCADFRATEASTNTHIGARTVAVVRSDAVRRYLLPPQACEESKICPDGHTTNGLPATLRIPGFLHRHHRPGARPRRSCQGDLPLRASSMMHENPCFVRMCPAHPPCCRSKAEHLRPKAAIPIGPSLSFALLGNRLSLAAPAPRGVPPQPLHASRVPLYVLSPCLCPPVPLHYPPRDIEDKRQTSRSPRGVSWMRRGRNEYDRPRSWKGQWKREWDKDNRYAVP